MIKVDIGQHAGEGLSVSMKKYAFTLNQTLALTLKIGC